MTLTREDAEDVVQEAFQLAVVISRNSKARRRFLRRTADISTVKSFWHARTFLHKPFRRGQADTTAAPRDYGDPSLKSSGHSGLLFLERLARPRGS